MAGEEANPPTCPEHGSPTRRATCASCNAAYMRGYLRRRRMEAPALTMWERARRRAHRLGVTFSLTRDAIVIPATCPALGIPLTTGQRRSLHSPSLDRIDPARGYVADNVRVLSDHANRLKSDRTQDELERRAQHGPLELRDDYAKVAAYVDREALLAEVRAKAAAGGRVGKEWEKIAIFLDRAFAHADWKGAHKIN